MSSLPRITVVTPSLNQGRFIERTIRSVLDQKYPDLEYFVVDGGSTDGTVDLLETYGSRIRWTSAKDRGQSDAVNKGLAQATGEVCSFLNADDLYEPGALLRVGEYFASHTEQVWLAGRCRIIDAEDREIRRLVTAYKNFWLRLGSYEVLTVLNYISQPAVFWRRRVMEEVGHLKETLHYGMDYDFWLRIGKRYPLDTLPEYLAGFRVHPSSKTGATTRQFNEMWEIVQDHCHSRFLLAMHRGHQRIGRLLYCWMLDRERKRIGKSPAGEAGG
jgi:glycosyltransferase involved in cell wall biosynthesis